MWIRCEDGTLLNTDRCSTIEYVPELGSGEDVYSPEFSESPKGSIIGFTEKRDVEVCSGLDRLEAMAVLRELIPVEFDFKSPRLIEDSKTTRVDANLNLEDVKLDTIAAALIKHSSVAKRACIDLGISERTLSYLKDKHFDELKKRGAYLVRYERRGARPKQLRNKENQDVE